MRVEAVVEKNLGGEKSRWEPSRFRWEGTSRRSESAWIQSDTRPGRVLFHPQFFAPISSTGIPIRVVAVAVVVVVVVVALFVLVLDLGLVLTLTYPYPVLVPVPVFV